MPEIPEQLTLGLKECSKENEASSGSPHTARTHSLHRLNHSPAAILQTLDVRSDNVSISQIIDPALILKDPRYNKGTAFTLEERNALRIRGLLPAAVESIETQVARAYRQFSRITVPLSKYIYLQGLKERNETLFYRFVIDYLEEMCPFIYTPTVGEACKEFDRQFRWCEGMYFSKSDRGIIRNMLENWKPNIMDTVSIIVVTDGSRILGLGDLGVCGMGIPVGKLSLYVAAGGFHPVTALPVVLDCGTNTEEQLADPFYLGEKHKRLSDAEFYALVDEFMLAVRDKWPHCLVQFEDFSNDHCFALLEKYRHSHLCFNDDIQGTGAVIAAGFINAVRIASLDLKELKVVFFGCGSAAVGVADQIRAVLEAEFGVNAAELINHFYFLDSRGLVYSSRGDELPDFKKRYARNDIKEPMKTLSEVVEKVKPHALIGLSCQGGAFTDEVITTMGKINERPIIFSLSNPTSKAECTAEAAYRLTEGRVLFASGSPFAPVTVNGVEHCPSQGNNLYAFPGLGFGAWLCKATKVTDGMITAATLALARSTPEAALAAGELYPRLKTVRDCTVAIASAVMQKAIQEGVARMGSSIPEDFPKFVKSQMYSPGYLDFEIADKHSK